MIACSLRGIRKLSLLNLILIQLTYHVQFIRKTNESCSIPVFIFFLSPSELPSRSDMKSGLSNLSSKNQTFKHEFSIAPAFNIDILYFFINFIYSYFIRFTDLRSRQILENVLVDVSLLCACICFHLFPFSLFLNHILFKYSFFCSPRSR